MKTLCALMLAILLTFATTLPAFAQEWRLLAPGEIAPALNDQTLSYGSASQKFYQSGKTLYDSSLPEWGQWRETNGQYCSLWPPSDVWTCYDLEISADGSAIRFIDAGGNATEGTFDATD